ncbi:MFS transporter [Bordetella holmesii]|uniref:MFS transporter n=4 Tax=Bordetella holmesii TaxID=35814 RepID=UPI001D159BAB|nr:MFS transporter [Bordetella holmesii]UEB21921.1 arabinose transporter [Bordetella holmesii]
MEKIVFPFFRSVPHGARLLWLTAVLFVCYLCIGMSFPVVPVYVADTLGLDNFWAGLAAGSAFLATIFTRTYAGGLADRVGVKPVTVRGLLIYMLGIGLSWTASLSSHWAAFAVLLAGRVLLGLGESLVAVGVVTWGIALVGAASSGRVLALIGAAMYGALALGGPVGLALFAHLGFGGVMLAASVLPLIALVGTLSLPGSPLQAAGARRGFLPILGRIWPYGTVVCLQGIGFAAIGAFFALHFLQRHWEYAGLGLTAFGAGFVLVRLVCGHLPDRVGGLPVVMASLAVEAAGQLMIGLADSPGMALAGAFLTGLGCSMVFPSMGREVVMRVEPAQRATALGAFSAFQDLAYGLTGPLAGLLADRSGYGHVFLIGALAAAAGLMLAMGLRRRQSAAR